MPGSKFKVLVEETLNSLDTKESRIARINQIRTQISQLESQIGDLKAQMQSEMHGLSGDLAVSVKNSLPGISISFDGDRCNIMHMANRISVRPDFANGLWDIEPNMSGRRFRRTHGHALGLTHDVNVLANEISSYFKGRYKRLSEGRPIKRVGISQTAASTQFV